MSEIRIRYNEVEDSRQYYPFAPSENINFYSIGDKLHDFKAQDASGEFLNVKITFDPKHQIISRAVFSFADLIGMIGGVNSMLLITASVFIGIFSNKIYMSALLSTFYQVPAKPTDPDNSAKQATNFTKLPRFSNSISDSNRGLNSQIKSLFHLKDECRILS